MGREFLFLARVLITTRDGTKVHDLCPGTQRNASLFRDVHSTDRIAH